jgi:hypothetical protein
METKAPRELPDSLDRIQVWAIRRKEIKAEAFDILLSPFLMENSMMVPDIVQNHDRRSTGSHRNLPQAAQELQKGLSIEAAHFAPELKVPVPQAHSSEVADAATGRVMLQGWVDDLRRDPHSTARTILLEMHFVESPEIHIACLQEVPEFFLCAAWR